MILLPQGGEELLIVVSAEETKSAVVLPMGPFSVYEDEELVLTGTTVKGIATNVSTIGISVSLSVKQGVVSVSTNPKLSFGAGDGLEDEFMLFHGPMGSVMSALRNITYRGHLNW